MQSAIGNFPGQKVNFPLKIGVARLYCPEKNPINLIYSLLTFNVIGNDRQFSTPACEVVRTFVKSVRVALGTVLVCV